MARDDTQFNLRLTAETKEKLKQRAKMNGRSLNAELVHIIDNYLATPSQIIGYRNEAERMAGHHAELFKKTVFDTLVKLYNDKK
ncbi:Arc family DNA-binding protein [Morganella morganii]|uniref:Arc family DNA-binding protein n=1 Tax=Morganella morganii TaxID=582 RepID=UPI001BDA18A0|nr:Arc family DNA-binding protein [Morganella morganii]MBT0494114.1 Arc family DNA-binding protein [Morganella morganii subsp. morganii]QWL94434.1 Arc family DNA-binding protein [Morganella morganii subsp. morganii]